MKINQLQVVKNDVKMKSIIFSMVLFLCFPGFSLAQSTRKVVQDYPVYAEMLKILAQHQECPKYFFINKKTQTNPHIFEIGKAGIADYLENPKWSFINSNEKVENNSASRRYLSKNVFKKDSGLSFTAKVGFSIFSPVAYSDDKNRCFAVYEEYNNNRKLVNVGAMFFELKDNNWILVKKYVPAIID